MALTSSVSIRVKFFAQSEIIISRCLISMVPTVHSESLKKLSLNVRIRCLSNSSLFLEVSEIGTCERRLSELDDNTVQNLERRNQF